MGAKQSRLACAMAVAVLMAVLCYRSPRSASNLEFVPDAVEYAVAGNHLAVEGRPFITVGGVKRPPRYLPWFPLVLAPAYWLIGADEIGNGIYVVTAMAVPGAAFAFFLGNRLGGLLGGGLRGGAAVLGARLSLLQQTTHDRRADGDHDAWRGPSSTCG